MHTRKQWRRRHTIDWRTMWDDNNNMTQCTLHSDNSTQLATQHFSFIPSLFICCSIHFLSHTRICHERSEWKIKREKIVINNSWCEWSSNVSTNQNIHFLTDSKTKKDKGANNDKRIDRSIATDFQAIIKRKRSGRKSIWSHSVRTAQQSKKRVKLTYVKNHNCTHNFQFSIHRNLQKQKRTRCQKVPDAREKEVECGRKETCIERSDRNQLQRNGKYYNYDWQIELWGSKESCQYV